MSSSPSKPVLKLDWCSYEAAKYAVEHWHYSRTMPTPPWVFVGVWEAGAFLGVVIFSRRANKNIGFAYGLEQTELCELTRVALREHEWPVSAIVSRALKMLRKESPGLRLVVSYADPYHGHTGAIYQAGNWIYTGQTGTDKRLRMADGSLLHSRQFSVNGVRTQYGTRRKVPKPTDGTIVEVPGKHKYLMPLDDAMRAQVEPLRQPYPKREPRGSGETDSAARTNAQTGGASPTGPL